MPFVLFPNDFLYQLPRNTTFPKKWQRLIKRYPFGRIHLSRQRKIFFLYNCPKAQHKHFFLVIRITFYVCYFFHCQTDFFRNLADYRVLRGFPDLHDPSNTDMARLRNIVLPQ